ncbi:vWA domain-containing protein [Jonesia quinghaiensis]|uniref:vWA domain-containing protein n=1 Tax=Jonesia quinghaiensis TaxID=262806 RepID=UPI00040E697C|nr:vWA domain-containing protein [Jonesia quinghaiensis]
MTFQPLAPLPALLIAVALVITGFGYLMFRDLTGPGVTRAQRTLWFRRSVMVVLASFIAFGPSRLELGTEAASTNLDVYFVVDRTGSMAAEDYDGSSPRLDGVREDMATILDELAGARFSIISFDSSASRQMPLTTDTTAIRNWVTSLNQEITYYSAGSSLERVYRELERTLSQGAERNPQNQRILYVFTDGENTTDTPRPTFEPLASYIDGGAVLGYGTEDGGRMKSYDPSGFQADDEYIVDWSTGDPAISQADPADIAALATELGVPHVMLNEQQDLTDFTEGFDPELIVSEGRRVVEIPQLMIWPFTAAMSLLLLWELAYQTSRAARKVG